MTKREPKRATVAPGLVIILLGMALMSIGLAAWLGWAIAATLLGGVLMAIGVWGAIEERASSDNKE